MSYDLNMLSESDGLVPSPLVFAGSKCTGVRKLAQRAMILLFKNKSSATWDMLGTSFGELAKGANVGRITDLDNRCAIAASGVAEALKLYQDSSGITDPDERLDGIVARVEEVAAGSVRVEFEITAESGAATTVSV